jgi:hypothetical protein
MTNKNGTELLHGCGRQLSAGFFLILAVGLWAGSAQSEVHFGTPANYRDLIKKLQPGDELVLEPGNYKNDLFLYNIHGMPGKPITIRTGTRGESGKVVFLAGPVNNTVSIKNASHLVIRGLYLDGRGQGVDAVKAEGTSQKAHHITLENLTIVGYGQNQQIVGISTKCPAWNWVVRGNLIIGAGTGMYFGEDNGTAPFIAGLIENNVIVNTIGYNLQIKHQKPRPQIEGMPTNASQTIIRNNIFSKANGGSMGEMARPNVLVGDFPAEGPGSQDRYVVYGNYFYQNPNESLFQAEGNLAIYNNVFVNEYSDALRFQPHRGKPRNILVAYNTLLGRHNAIYLDRPDKNSQQEIVGNLSFGQFPIKAVAAFPMNHTGTFQDAQALLKAPLERQGGRDFSPLKRVTKKEVRVTYAEALRLPGWDRDFYGRPKDFENLGAMNPGAVPRLLEIRADSANKQD